MRSKEKKSQVAAKRSKNVTDYDWNTLLTDGAIGKLTVAELNKYLEHHNLPLDGKKPDKIRTIAAHISSDLLRGHASVQVHADTDEEDEEEEIIEEVSSESEEENEENRVQSPQVRSRSGRAVKRKNYGDDYVY